MVLTRSLSALAPAARPPRSSSPRRAAGFLFSRKVRRCRPTAAHRTRASSSARAGSTITILGLIVTANRSFPLSSTISAARPSGTARRSCGSRRTSSRTRPPISAAAGHSPMKSLSLTTTRPKRCCACAGSRSSPTPRRSSPRSSEFSLPGAPRRCRSACRPIFLMTRMKRPVSMASPPRMASNPTPRLA